MTVMTVRPGSGLVTTIERYAVRPEETAPDGDEFQVVNTPPKLGAATTPTADVEFARYYIENTLRLAPGFVAALLLQGQNDEIAVYAQWETAEPAPGVRPKQSVRPAFPRDSALGLIDARTFTTDFAAPNDSTVFSMATTPRAHFGVFAMPPTAQERLLRNARASAPKSIGTPGLQAINFHRSLDGSEVINLGAWSAFDGFGELLQRPGFHENGKWYEGLASFRNYFFTVVDLIGKP